MEKDARILVTGGGGFVGRNLFEYLQCRGFTDVALTVGDLTDVRTVDLEFMFRRPEYVFRCAGFVRGIAGNMANQARSYRINTLINTNVVAACIERQVKKLVAMGTVAMYPDRDGRPYRESDIHLGPAHRGEYGYAMAKRGMLAHLEVSGLDWVMPLATNMYGPHDRFDVEHGHVIPSLVRKFYERDVTVWGDGSQGRDFFYIKDVVRALLLVMEKAEGPINFATGETRAIRDVVTALEVCSGFHDVRFDPTKPVGQKVRFYDVSGLRALRFSPEYTLEEGLRETYDWYAANAATARKQ